MRGTPFLVVCVYTQVPKRGLPTPRYLLKLRTEVEIMQQLGYSLDAVNLKDVFEVGLLQQPFVVFSMALFAALLIPATLVVLLFC